MLCAIGYSPYHILCHKRIETQKPEETLTQIADFFLKNQTAYGALDGLGIGFFGPTELNAQHPHWGRILSSPKKVWQGINVPQKLRHKLGNIPIAYQTDVNAAALGEGLKRGAAEGLTHYIYLTIGTGIGGGVIANNRLLTGSPHPEIGHMCVPRHPQDTFQGICPYHSNCLEGLASGKAMEMRWKKPAYLLDENHLAWDIEAFYLNALCQNMLACYAPQAIILGGGVLESAFLFEKLQKVFYKSQTGYWNLPHNFLRKPLQTPSSALCGAFHLARCSLSSPSI